MMLVLELPPELERDLAARAAELQLPLAEYAVRVLAGAEVAAPKSAMARNCWHIGRPKGWLEPSPNLRPGGAVRELRCEAERRTR